MAETSFIESKAFKENGMNGPAPDNPHPMAGFPQVGFLRPLVKNPNIEVGDYSYYDDPAGPELSDGVGNG